jgi:hypothetical protein
MDGCYCPNAFVLDFPIFVRQYMALSNYFRPWNLRVFLSKTGRDISGRFAYYFDVAFNRTAEQAV